MSQGHGPPSDRPFPGGSGGSPAGGAEPVAGTTGGEAAYACDCCGTTMFEFHCRIICPRCGYQRDCSDP